MLGVKLITLSASPSPPCFCPGVLGAGTVLPRGRVGVVFEFGEVLLRKLRLLAVRLTSDGVGVLSRGSVESEAVFVTVDKVLGLDEGLILLGDSLALLFDGWMSHGDGLEYPALLLLPTILIVEDGMWWLEYGGSAEAAEGARDDFVESCLYRGLASASDLDTERRRTTMTSLEISKS